LTVKDRAELLDALIEDAGARWSLTVIASTLTLTVLELFSVPRDVALGVVAIVASVGPVGLSLKWRLASGLVAWALLTGFVYNRFGVLTFTEPDMTRMSILVGVAVLATPLFGRRTERTG
jgi:hypothetical protein